VDRDDVITRPDDAIQLERERVAGLGPALVFAVVVVIWAFGWAGGKALVERSYADARAQAKRRAEPA
jgi:hypothetical protein